MYFKTIALLTAQTSVPLNAEFIVGGFSNPGDGGGGTFIWIPKVPTLPDDGGIILYAPNADPITNPGYFQRIFSGPINVRWFGATGDGVSDDTAAVHAARDSEAFANNGTLYFPIGRYRGAFIFDFNYGVRNEINITGDGHGSVLVSFEGKTDPMQPLYDPVLTLGYKTNTWQWARVSNLTIDGKGLGLVQGAPLASVGVAFANPADGLNTEAGRWVFERIHITNCYIGVFKPYGNIGNHFIDCDWGSNSIGVKAVGVPGIMHAGCDRYSGGHVSGSAIAGLLYEGGDGGTPQIIIDGTIFENNHSAWAISISSSSVSSMLSNAVSLRNVWFEQNGEGANGGDMYFNGLRSVRIDDCRIFDRISLVDSSVNLYNCLLTRNSGNVGNLDYAVDVDDKSALVAYELRYFGFPTSKVFVNSISYDGSHDIQNEPWQSTSVWGPLRCVTSTRSQFLVSEQFDTIPHLFVNIPFGSGSQNTYINPNRVLGTGSGRLSIAAGTKLLSNDVIGTIGPDPIPKYIVWSIHTFLQDQTPPPPGFVVDELYGEIYSGGTFLGRAYFKYNQWACSYGMKLVDISNKLDFVLEFQSSFAAIFDITNYQILAFDDLSSANAFVNSREFCTWNGG